MTNNQPVTITVLRSGLMVPHNNFANRVAYRGEVLHLTAEQVESAKDRNGFSWLDMTDEDQEARWGEIKFKIGDHSAEIGFLGDDDSTVRFRRRENAVIAARRITDPVERAAALKEITDTYGAPDSGQRSISYGK